LKYKKEFVETLRDNRYIVLEYWEKYRYLGEVNAICKIQDEKEQDKIEEIEYLIDNRGWQTLLILKVRGD